MKKESKKTQRTREGGEPQGFGGTVGAPKRLYKTVRGMRDLMPEQARKREYVLDTVRNVFRNYGFEPMETPAVESIELLAAKGGGGEEIKKEIYCFKDQGGRGLGLRYDLTVSTARVVASNPSLPKPFKRYIYGKAWRYDRPQAGRYREFTQIDIDIFGPGTPEADFEIFAATVAAFKALGFKGVKVRINNRKVSEALVLAAGIPKAKVVEAFRSTDKLDKIGWEGVGKELKDRKVPNANKLIALIKGNKLRKEFEEFEIGKQGVAELKVFLELAKKTGLEKYAELDLSLVRGLEYYTGIVYEVMVGGKLSCGGGGRYDKLVGVYDGQPTPAVGISYGVDRVMQVMDKMKLFPELTKTEYYVAPVNKEMQGEALRIAEKMRAKGLRVDTDVAGRNLRKQLDYVNAKGIPKVVIVGPKELKEKKVTIRDMKTGKEEKKALKNLC